MIAVTVWQPWASLIAYGWKPFEFRGWRAPRAYVGKRIAIHAGVRKPRPQEITDLVMQLLSSEWRATGVNLDALPALNNWAVDPRLLPLGFVVGTATLGEPIKNEELAAAMGVKWVNDSDRVGDSNWGWPMLNVKRCDPTVHATGRQGLWTFSGDLP